MSPAYIPSPPERHFSRVWALLTLLAVLITLPLELVGAHWWPRLAGQVAALGFTAFAAAEYVAGGVRHGTSGYYTQWWYFRVRTSYLRFALGTWLAWLLWWRLPEPFGLVIGLGLWAWLPCHLTLPQFENRWLRSIRSNMAARFFLYGWLGVLLVNALVVAFD